MRTTCLILCFLLSAQLFAEPTEDRDWHSTAGTTIKASALSLEEGEVELKAADGRIFKVPLDKLTEEDQNFLTEHFSSQDGEPEEPEEPGIKGSTVEMVKEGLAQPVGQVSGPIEAGKKSTYYVYVPTTLRKDRKAALMFITEASGGSEDSVKNYIEGAELNGMMLAASVESMDGEDGPVENHEHAKACVAHLIETLPIDPDRVYFSGESGGGAMAFYNAARIRSAGSMPIAGYAPDDEINTDGYCFAIGGTTDYNRYLTAGAASLFNDNGIHRFFVGGHVGWPADLGIEGIIWLNGHYLAEHEEYPFLAEERQDFEASIINWIVKLRSSSEYRAHYWCSFLLDSYGIHGPNMDFVDNMMRELEENPDNLRYTEGIEELNEFSERYFAIEELGGGPKYDHTTDEIVEAVAEITDEFADVSEIEELAKQLGAKTVAKEKE